MFSPQSKVIIFLSTCKQVRFAHEAFRKLRPGVPLRALHGRMNQVRGAAGSGANDHAAWLLLLLLLLLPLRFCVSLCLASSLA